MGTTKKSLAIFWRANVKHPSYFFGSITLFTIGLILQKIILPLIVAGAINTLITINGQSHSDYWHIFAPYVIGFGILMLCAQVMFDAGLVLLSRLETKVRPELQMRVFDRLVTQSLNFHANNFSGSLVSQTNKFTGAYVVLTDVLSLSLLITFVTSIIAIGVTAFFLPLVALAMVVWTIFFVWLNIALTRRRMKYSRAAANAESVMTAHLADTIGNVAAIKAFGRETDEYKLHKQKSDDRAHKKYISWISATKNDFAIGLMMGTLQLIVLVLSIYSVMQGSLSIGILLLVQVYVTQLIGQLWGLSNMTRSIEQAISDAAEMTELLEEDLDVKDPKHPKKVAFTKGEIAFNNVVFTHSGSNDALFDAFNLTVKPGEKVGLVGHSGSGKTSLTRLLLRFVDIDSGSIEIDGQNIADVAQSDLRAHIAYVPQEPILFHRSLQENIAYGKPNATLDQIKEAARLAHAAEFIEKLPKGYDTMVGERGVKLSGGQRQRIAIARAILKDAPILVLDEATSALDSESELLIQDALKKLMQGRTTIVIAHRLSTIQTMDRIIVLKDGAIIEQGPHASLLEKKGIYAGLWRHQSGGFIEE